MEARIPIGKFVSIPFAVFLLAATSCGRTSVSSPRAAVLAFVQESVVTHGLRMQSGPRSKRTLLDVQLAAEGLEDPFTISYSLSYPHELMRWVEFEEGAYLSEDGDVETTLQVAEGPAGVLRIDHARDAGSGPFDPEAVRTNVTLSLRFDAHASGSGRFAVRDLRIARSDGSETPGLQEAEARVVIDLANLE